MSELFDEVDEDVRREQLKKLWDKYSIHIVAMALLVIAAVGGWRGYQYLEAKKAAEASVAFNKAVDLSDQNKHAEAEAAFNSLAATAPSGYRLLARLRAASEVASRDPQAAVKLYDDIAADRGVAALDQELARVRAAQLLVDKSPYPDLLTRLQSETESTATFRHTARELLALSAWRNGDTAAARKWAEAAGSDPEAPQGVRARAEVINTLLADTSKT